MRIKIPLLVSIFVLIISLISQVSAQSERTPTQVDRLIKEKKSRTRIQKKIDSQLLQAIREKQGKQMCAGVDLEPANVNADKEGNLKVDIQADVTDLLLNRIRNIGGIIIYPSKQYHTIRAQVNLSIVEKIAGFPGVKFIAPAAVPIFNAPVKPNNR